MLQKTQQLDPQHRKLNRVQKSVFIYVYTHNYNNSHDSLTFYIYFFLKEAVNKN